MGGPQTIIQRLRERIRCLSTHIIQAQNEMRGRALFLVVWHSREDHKELVSGHQVISKDYPEARLTAFIITGPA